MQTHSRLEGAEKLQRAHSASVGGGHGPVPFCLSAVYEYSAGSLVTVCCPWTRFSLSVPVRCPVRCMQNVSQVAGIAPVHTATPVRGGLYGPDSVPGWSRLQARKPLGQWGQLVPTTLGPWRRCPQNRQPEQRSCYIVKVSLRFYR